MQLTKKYVVFLDIDGVFTSSRVHQSADIYKSPMWDKFDPVAVDFMNRLDEQHDIDFVLMSTWKNGLNPHDTTVYHWVLAAFRNAGFRGHFPYPEWKTDPNNDAPGNRADHVKTFLSLNCYDDFLLFDDNDYQFNDKLDKRRFVKTDAENGLLIKHMRNALSITGMWEKKSTVN